VFWVASNHGFSRGYCESGKHPMKLQDGSDAKGVLGESATPFCGDGFEASGTSECALDVLKKNG